MISPDSDLLTFIQALPKTETHVHLEGSLPLAVLRQVWPEAPVPASWAPDYKFRDFAHFESELLALSGVWCKTPERYHQAARAIFATHLAQNVKYVEISFATGSVQFAGIDMHEVAVAIAEAAPPGLTVRVFMGIHHNGAGPEMRPVLEDALSWPELAGIDLHGEETLPLETWSAPYWEAARQAGKYTKAHAGEFMGAGFIRQVLCELQPQRLEHGVRAVEDPALMAELRQRGVALDVCPISNHKLMPGITLAQHPIRQLVAAGVTVTVNTDDTLSFGNTLTDEYAALATHCRFSRRELAQLARNGFSVALLPEAQKQVWLAEIDRVAGGKA